MLAPRGARRLWVCARCVRRRLPLASRRPPPPRRWQLTAAAASAETPPDHGASSRHDDAVLRELFDAPSPARPRPLAGLGLGAKSVGLFKNRFLTSPDGFLVFARRNLDKATALVRRVLAASSTAEYRGLVRDLDRLSDLLCRVLDLSDFVRMTHPDVRFQRAAAAAWSMVYQYMNQLNTATGLNDQLARAMARPDVVAAWSDEEVAVAELLRLDFTKSAVNLPKRDRDRFVDLSSRISDVGSAFVRDMAPRRRELTLPARRLRGLAPGPLDARSPPVTLPTTGPEAAAALQRVDDEDTRRDLYLAQRTASHRTIALLETMLRLRAELARLAGFDSYGHMALKDRMMARSPAAVGEFLRALRAHNAPAVARELSHLTAKKRERLAAPAARLQPWDRDFYMDKVRADMRARGDADAPPAASAASADPLAAYFSVGTVMQGLSRLLDRLYGVRFVARDALPGETWHPEVKRLDVVSDAGELLAVLYCDLFYRPQKSPNPAHFTVRCSREILPAEVADAAADLDAAGAPAFDSPEQAANDGMETSSDSGTLMQLPTIALVCDFPKNDNAREPALLSYGSVETLFHEMGHAMHSVLARTGFQNVSGTRCATDFAELPSTLMEHFAADPAVLGLYARHWETDRPLPPGLVAERIRLARRFEACDTEHQILLAMLDQAYHGRGAAGAAFDSTAVFHDVARRAVDGPRDPPETCWQGFFGHLHSYGSTYYSYLFDRVLAERVWRVVFAAGHPAGAALARDAGERLKRNLLCWGGGRDPWRCLADTLVDDRLAPGDARSMALVGSWGIKDDQALPPA